MSRIDAVTGIRMLIENAFSNLTWHEEACAYLNFKGISQVWKEEPAWYFWRDDVPGAFLLRLLEDEPIADSQYVSMTLHYYPAAENAANLALTAEEHALLNYTATFDQPTCTPRYEEFESCLPHFIAAEVGVMIGADNQLQLLVFSTGKAPSHPVFDFIDLLVSTLNFEAKTHHQTAAQLDAPGANSLFLIYDTSAFNTFQFTFGLEESPLSEPKNTKRLANWRHCAHMDISCSMNGACSCH